MVDVIKVVAKFWYVWDVLNFGRGLQEAVTARLRFGWKKFQDTAFILCKRVLSLKVIKRMYKSCVRSILCCGAECWALRKEDRRKLETTKLRMLCKIY